MAKQIVIGKFEAIFPYDILMRDKVSTSLRINWEGVGNAILYPPEKLGRRKPKQGRYGSKIRVDMGLDINQKPTDYKLDLFFMEKFIEFSYAFLSETWFQTKMTDIDPYIHPLYVKVEYYNKDGTRFINPETQKSSYEENMPRGAILDKDDWVKIIDNVIEGKARDISEHLLLNARYMKSVRRWDVAILLCAIACEYKIKRCCEIFAMRNKVPSGLWEIIVQKIRPRVMTYYDSIAPQLGVGSMRESTDERIRELPERLRELFDDRNIIVHTGSIVNLLGQKLTVDIVIQRIDKHIETTERVLNWLDSQLT